MKLNKLERLSKVIEYLLDGMLKDPELAKSHHVARYNRWIDEFHAEIVHNHMQTDTSNLNVSDFMRSVICHRVNWYQNLGRDRFRNNKRF